MLQISPIQYDNFFPTCEFLYCFNNTLYVYCGYIASWCHHEQY